MKFIDAISVCHVRSAIYRSTIGPEIRYWKNHHVLLSSRVPSEDQKFEDWEEYDPRDRPECSAYNEFPA